MFVSSVEAVGKSISCCPATTSDLVTLGRETMATCQSDQELTGGDLIVDPSRRSCRGNFRDTCAERLAFRSRANEQVASPRAIRTNSASGSLLSGSDLFV